MAINKVLTPFAFVAAMALASAPAFAQHRGGSGRSAGHAQARSSSGSGYRGGAVVRSAPRVYAPRVYAPRVYAPRAYYGRPYYYRPYYARPYYSFRPYVGVGFGITLGYPVPYPYYATPYPAYAYPYPADPNAYQVTPYGAPSYPQSGYGTQAYPPNGYSPQGYSAQGSAPQVDPRNAPQSNHGGISFEITPQEATIYVDGAYVGTAGEFGPDQRPLDLTAGRHRVEIRAQGYRGTSFDADVRAGQVLPYQGTLQQD
jgi:PEGA domain